MSCGFLLYMILEENYVHQCTQTSKYPYWWALIQCEDCNKLFLMLRRNARRSKSGAKYCSTCRQKGERAYWYDRKDYPKEAIAKASAAIRGKPRSTEWCKNIGLSKKGRKLTQETRRKMSLARMGEKNPQYGKRGELSTMWGRRGPLSPNYNPALTDYDRRNYRSPEVSAWRRSVFERDHFTCQITGRKGGKLAAHHLDGWDGHPSKRFDPNNGITISEALHDLFHEIYGKGNNTYEQFFEFCTKFTNSPVIT